LVSLQNLIQKAFVFAFSDLPHYSGERPEEVVRKILDGGRDLFLKQVNARLISESDVSVAGFVGRAVTGTDPDGFIYKYRFYIIRDNFVMLSVATDKNYASRPEVDYFFNSFALK